MSQPIYLTECEYSYSSAGASTAHLFLMQPLLHLLPNLQTATEPVKLLDLGCGNGSLSNALALRGYDVTGVEESPSGITIARQNFPKVQFIQASIYDFCPPPELQQTFDVVISVEVIEHLFYPRELVRLAHQLLKPEGRLILTTPYHGYLKNLALALSGKMDRHFHVLWDGGHIKFFSVETLTRLLEAEGYADISFKFAGRTPYLWKSMLCSCTPK